MTKKTSDYVGKKSDVDWTNSQKFGYLGANNKNSRRHIVEKEKFVRIANKEGFASGDPITREDIMMLLEQYPELVEPHWFMNFRNKDGNNPYKLEWTKGYILPVLDGVSEVEDIYLAIDNLPREHLLKLPKKQHEVVLLRYGINDGIMRTFKEVMKEMGEKHDARCWHLNQSALLKLEEHSGTKLVINIVDSTREK